ncbi:hypothetical protein WJX77_006909 [Trebouxia sp. C0004]
MAVMLSLAAPIAAQQIVADSQGTCPVSIDYAVSLGEGGGDNSNVPIFVASLGITNRANLTVQSWRLAWNFTNGEVLAEAADYFPNTSYPLPGSFNTSHVQIQSTSLTAADEQQAQNAWFYPSQEQTLQFLGTKAAIGVDPANPYKVAPVSNLLFNNFVCEAHGSGNVSINGSTAKQTQYEAFVGTVAPTSTIYLEYTPITYVNLPVNLNPFTQFLVRLTNIGNTSLVLDDITLDYWFNGPAGSSVSIDQFRPVCSDTTIGCEALLSSITTAYPDAQGARFKITLGFNTTGYNPEGVVLIPTLGGSGAVPEPAPGLAPAPAPSGPLQLTEMEVLFSVSSTQFLVPINSTLDYSYLNTSTNGLPTNTSDNQTYIIPRTALPNSKITAYLNGTLVWGSQPVLVQVGQGAPAEAPAAALPAGINCQTSPDGTQVCGLSATYCCYGDGPLSEVNPNIWPPSVITQPPNLNSNTAAAPAPAPEPGLLLAPAPSNATLQVNGTESVGSVFSPAPTPGVSTPVLVPSPALGNETLSPAGNETVPAPAPTDTTMLPNQTAGLLPRISTSAPVPAPATSLSSAQQSTPIAALPNQTTLAAALPNSPIPSASLPNQTNSAATPAAVPTPAATPKVTPVVTPAVSLALAAATSSPSAEQIAANNALGPLLSPANAAWLPASAPAPGASAPAPAPGSANSGSALGATAGQGQTAKAGIGSGAIAGIAVAAVAGAAVASSAAAFLILQRRRSSVHSRHPPKSGIPASSKARPHQADPDPEGGLPISLLPVARTLNGHEDRWHALESNPLRGALLESNSTAMTRSGDSNQSWLEMGYAPPTAYALQRHGSNMSQDGPGQGLVNPGLITANPGLNQGDSKPNGAVRHQRWNENPFVDARWPFTPLAAEQNDAHHAPYGDGRYQRLPYDNRGESSMGPLVRAGSNVTRQGSGLIRFGSGDQHVNNNLIQRRQGMLRQASSPGQFANSPIGLGMPWHASEMEQLWAPSIGMLTAAGAAASAGSLVMHGPHSLLERPGQGESWSPA